MKKTLIFGALVLAISVISCGEDKKETRIYPMQNQMQDRELTQAEVEFKTETSDTLYSLYLQMKDALVRSEMQATLEAANKMSAALEGKEVSARLTAAVDEMVAAENIEAQREYFVELTSAVEERLSSDIVSGEFYKQYCPMAFNNSGASWLSGSKEIRNPYFGDRMLKCGRVETTVSAK
jgi:hypothetical protein